MHVGVETGFNTKLRARGVSNFPIMLKDKAKPIIHLMQLDVLVYRHTLLKCRWVVERLASVPSQMQVGPKPDEHCMAHFMHEKMNSGLYTIQISSSGVRQRLRAYPQHLNVRTFSEIALRHIGHVKILFAHDTHTARWPQGLSVI